MVVIRISKRELLEARYQRRAHNTMLPPKKKGKKEDRNVTWKTEDSATQIP